MSSSMTPTNMSSFAEWARTADAVRATTRKLRKLDALAAYFGTLADADLPVAARLFAGGPFSRADQRVLSVGWSALTEAILERSGASGDDMGASYQRHADLGDVAAELITRAPPDGRPLSLAGLAAAFDEIAGTRGSNAKRALVRALLAVVGNEGSGRIEVSLSKLDNAMAKSMQKARVEHYLRLIGKVCPSGTLPALVLRAIGSVAHEQWEHEVKMPSVKTIERLRLKQWAASVVLLEKYQPVLIDIVRKMWR